MRRSTPVKELTASAALAASIPAAAQAATAIVALKRLWRPGMERRSLVILLPLRWMSPQWQPFAMEVILVVQERPAAEPLGSLSGSPSESRIHSTFALTPSR